MTQHRMQARAGRPWFEERDLEVVIVRRIYKAAKSTYRIGRKKAV